MPTKTFPFQAAAEAPIRWKFESRIISITTRQASLWKVNIASSPANCVTLIRYLREPREYVLSATMALWRRAVRSTISQPTALATFVTNRAAFLPQPAWSTARLTRPASPVTMVHWPWDKRGTTSPPTRPAGNAIRWVAPGFPPIFRMKASATNA